jgi:tetratricopeptide (TPR) repeat protein
MAEAGNLLEKARRDWPTSGKILFAQGLWQQLAGHPEKAEVAFRQAADLSWRWEAPSLALGNLYSKSQVPGRAVEALDQAIALFPSSPWPHWFKALALTNATPRLEEQALSELELSQELAPNQPDIYPALLVSVLRRNDCGGAARLWATMTSFGLAKELDPSQWCAPESDSTSRRTSLPDNVFDQYSETRLLAEMASDNSDSPPSGR